VTERRGHIGPLARLAEWVRAAFRRLRGLITGAGAKRSLADGPPAHWLADLEAKGLSQGSWSGYGAGVEVPPLAAPGRVPGRNHGPSQSFARAPEGAARSATTPRGDAAPLLSRPTPVQARAQQPDAVPSPVSKSAAQADRSRDRPRRSVRVHTRVEVLTASDAKALRVAAIPRDAAASVDLQREARDATSSTRVLAQDRSSNDPVQVAVEPPAQGPISSGPNVATRVDEQEHTTAIAARAVPDPVRVGPDLYDVTLHHRITAPPVRDAAQVRGTGPADRVSSDPAAQGAPRNMPPRHGTERSRLPDPPEADVTSRFPALPSPSARSPERGASAPDRFFQEADDTLRRIVWGPR